MANSYDEDDATGDEIEKDLADVAQKPGAKKLCSEKIESLVEKYRQPQNCSDVKGIKVNPEIWSQFTAKQRKTDLKISNLQQIIRRTTLATLQTTNMLIDNSSVPHTNKIMAQQVGTIAMLGHVNTQFAQLQIDEIKPSLKAEYTAICSTEVPISSQYLFGDDLAEQLRDAEEASKIGFSVAFISKTGLYKGKQHISNQHDRYNKGPKKEFLWKGHNRSYQRKKLPNNQKK